MDKFSFGAYDSTNTDVVFNDPSYVDPASESETRKQFSYPLHEIKDYLRNTCNITSSDDVIQLKLDFLSNGLKYTTDGSTWNDITFYGQTGRGVPSGGTTGQYLKKKSAYDYDTEWTNFPNDLPQGGSTGQALVKKSGTDYDIEWSSLVPSGGTTGQVLVKKSGTDYDVEWSTPKKWLAVPDTSNVIMRIEKNVVEGITYTATEPCIVFCHGTGGNNGTSDTTITLNNVSLGTYDLRDVVFAMDTDDVLHIPGLSTWTTSLVAVGIKWVAV